MLKYGLKIWSTNKQWFSQAVALCRSGRVDFVELYVVPGSFRLTDMEVFKTVPTAIHAPHFEHNFNIFELDKNKINLFEGQVIKVADFLASQFIIVHAGIGDSPALFKKNIKKIADKRLLIENKPKIALDGRICFGYSLAQIKFIKEECGLDICLDFSHAAKAALTEKLPYKQFTEKIIEAVNPRYYHICGIYFNGDVDEHQDLFEGDLDVKWVKEILLALAKDKDIHLVFEVPKNGLNLENDLKNIDYFKKL